MSEMETTDIVIHKGEKEEKYQLYVEDYVMSYLKKYGAEDSRKIFFYGTREQKNKRYYIYGAGRQKNISYFVRYELLDEITCSYDMDKPVFFIKEYSGKGDSGKYELAGYYIFYQTNEAMQSYMIEQRKEDGSEGSQTDKFKSQAGENAQSKNRPQDFSDIRMRSGIKTGDEQKEDIDRRKIKRNRPLMALQLFAVFLILAAIVINTTNSYSKLQELGKSAVEVFFAIENQEAADREAVSEKDGNKGKTENSEESDSANSSDTTVLRLEDMDAELEKENQAAKQEEAEDANIQEADMEVGNEDKENSDIDDTAENEEKDNVEENNADEDKADSNKGTDVSDQDKADSDNGTENITGNNTAENQEANNADENKADTSENAQVQEAFARNLNEYYKIEKGDTLCNISIRLYGDASKVKEICEINKIEDPDNIKYGQKIILPQP